MRILGVDPGTHRAGLGLIECEAQRYRLIHFEVVRTDSKAPIQERLKTVYQSVISVIRTFQPQVMALEKAFYCKDIRALIRIGEARACAMLAAAQEGLELAEYAPTHIKKAVAGNGRASKEQIQHMTKMLLNLKELPPSDGADALAIAICHFHMNQNRSRKHELLAAMKR